MSLSVSDTLELKDRLDTLMDEYSSLSLEVAKKLDRFGKVRAELQLIVAELMKRGERAEPSEEKKKIIEERLKDAKIDTTKGSPQS